MHVRHKRQRTATLCKATVEDDRPGLRDANRASRQRRTNAMELARLAPGAEARQAMQQAVTIERPRHRPRETLRALVAPFLGERPGESSHRRALRTCGLALRDHASPKVDEDAGDVDLDGADR